VANPFDDDSARFIVLIKEECQYPLLPVHIQVPGCWPVDRPSGLRFARGGHWRNRWKIQTEGRVANRH